MVAALQPIAPSSGCARPPTLRRYASAADAVVGRWIVAGHGRGSTGLGRLDRRGRGSTGACARHRGPAGRAPTRWRIRPQSGRGHERRGRRSGGGPGADARTFEARQPRLVLLDAAGRARRFRYDELDGRVVREQLPVEHPLRVCPRPQGRRQRAAHEAAANEDVVHARPGRRVPLVEARRHLLHRRRHDELEVEVAGDDDRLLGLRRAVDELQRAQQLGLGEAAVASQARRVQVRDQQPVPVGALEVDDLAHAPLALPPASLLQVEPELARLLLAERVRVERDLLLLPDRDVLRHGGSRCPCRASRPSSRRCPAPRAGRASTCACGRSPPACPTRRPGSRTPRRALPAGRRSRSCRQAMRSTISRRWPPLPSGAVLPRWRFQARTSIGLYCTRPCASRSRIRRRTRPGTTTSSPPPSRGKAPWSRWRPRASASRSCRPPTATGASSASIRSRRRVFQRSRARLPLKALEHAGVVGSLSSRSTDVLHVQWLPLPQADSFVRFRSPSVFTAHDLLPRRTADKRALWKRLLGALRPRDRAHAPRPRHAARPRRRSARRAASRSTRAPPSTPTTARRCSHSA